MQFYVGPQSRSEIRCYDHLVESVVGIFAEGKEHALAIGITTMSSEQIRTENKGIAVENTHWLRDGLWLMPKVE